MKLPRNVIALGVASLLNDMSSEITIKTIPLFLKGALGVKTSVIGLIEGIADTTATLLKLIAGILSDRMGKRKPLTLGGYALSNGIKPLLFFAASWPMVLVLRVIDRVGKGIRGSPRDALLTDSVDETNRGRAFGFQRAMDPIGSVLGLLIASALLYAGYGNDPVLGSDAYRLLVLVGAVPAALCVLVIILAVTEPPSLTPVNKKFSLRGTLPSGMKRYLLALFVFNLGVMSEGLLPLRAQELGVPLWATLLLMALLSVASSLAAYPAGVLSDRIGRRGLVAVGWVVFGFQLAGFALATEAWHLGALFLLRGLSEGLREGVEKALVADLSPAETRGTSFGYFYFIMGAAALPASALAGGLWEAYSPAVAFGTAAALSVIGAVLLAAVPARR